MMCCSRCPRTDVCRIFLPNVCPLASTQLLDVAVLGCGGALTGTAHGGAGASAAAVRRLVVTVALPTLQALTTAPAVAHAGGYSPYRPPTGHGQVTLTHASCGNPHARSLPPLIFSPPRLAP
jgi:hypothetical protein